VNLETACLEANQLATPANSLTRRVFGRYFVRAHSEARVSLPHSAAFLRLVAQGLDLMEFENDVFVSYAHIDNQALTDGPGWITSLHNALRIRLEQLLGKEAKIWRDPKLTGNDMFADRLVDSLPRVAVLVSVLSPRYVRSEWCQRELNEFIKASVATGGLRIADKLRVFKVVKTPVPRELEPPPLQPALGYEFYTVEPDSGRQRELDPSSPDAKRQYWIKFDDLAHDIADLLLVLENEAHGVLPSPSASKGVVYLAETSSDLNDRRDAIKRDLLGFGYLVLPDQPLPLVGPECTAFVRDQLARCRLSVHMVGENYGIVPDHSTDSIVVLQHELAIERAAAGGFCRLIWMPPDLTTDDVRQQQFIERLQQDSKIQSGADGDILIRPLEDFKSLLHVRLNPPDAPKQARQPATSQQTVVPHVYIICDQRDCEGARPLAEFLFDQSFEVTLSGFGGDEAQVRLDHEANLTTCDAALIYWGAGNELWLRSKLRELLKIAGYGRSKPIAAKAVYVTAPAAPEKARFRTHEAIVINAGETVTPSTLEPFLSRLREA
jgi:hypothetical protein